MTEPKVFLGIPIYGELVHISLLHAILWAKRGGVPWTVRGFSVLTRNFNELWVMALNARPDGVTHFAMLHEDVQPQQWWIDHLLKIMAREQADVLSVVLPIKDGSGFTSTAIDDTSNISKPRRLKLTELPAPTFTDPLLLVNTGCLLVDLNRPWVEETWFEFHDRILQCEGRWIAENVSEDWAWSRMAREAGATLYATTEVSAVHHGRAGFPNQVGQAPQVTAVT